MPLSAGERSLRGKLAVETSWANTTDRPARTAKARRALEDKFLAEAGGTRSRLSIYAAPTTPVWRWHPRRPAAAGVVIPMPPNEKKGRVPHHQDPTPHLHDTFGPTLEASGISDGSTTGQPVVSSQQVSWWSVYEYIAGPLEQARSWPMAGTPQWCALDDDDPAKLAALFDAAQHWSLRVETCQQQLAEVSHDIAATEDWRSIANEMRRRDVYIPREVA